MSEAKQVDFLLTGLTNPETGEPLSGGAVYVYEAETATATNLWLDRNKTDLAPNPIILDSAGKALVFGDGVYRFVIRAVANVTEPIVAEYDGLEYTPLIVSDTQLPLSQNLDFAGFKGINVGDGADPDDTIRYGQVTDIQAALQTAIDQVQSNLDATEFLDLTDTPNVYTAANNKLVRVRDDLQGLEFINISDAMVDAHFLDLNDTPESYTTHAGKGVMVNSSASGLTFGYPDSKTIQGVNVDSSAPADGALMTYSSAESKWKPVVHGTESLGITRTLLWSGSAVNTPVTVEAPGALLFTIQHAVYNTTNITVDPVAVAEGNGVVLQHWSSPNGDRSYDATISISKSGDTFTLQSTGTMTRITALLMSGT